MELFKSFFVVVICFFVVESYVFSEEIRDYYSDPGITPFKDGVVYGDNENIDTFSGKLQLKYRDVYIPGNGGMDISIYRTYTSIQAKSFPHRTPYGVGWTMHMGRIVTPKAYSDRVCSQSMWVGDTRKLLLKSITKRAQLIKSV
ncbi:hypothetical protein [Bacterioplanoides pacificum]|uniref:Uncharacterized protein n=1 Tax=Bacterioplanoides pacificum TaxID=1171596 RepID=A0ABV7VMX3_9GAMM